MVDASYFVLTFVTGDEKCQWRWWSWTTGNCSGITFSSQLLAKTASTISLHLLYLMHCSTARCHASVVYVELMFITCQYYIKMASCNRQATSNQYCKIQCGPRILFFWRQSTIKFQCDPKAHKRK